MPDLAYNVTLVLHNIIRWIVVIAGMVAAIRAVVGWLGSRQWSDLDNRLGLIFTISLDIQVLLGLLLYFVLSPITTNAFSDFGQAMSEAGTRFYFVEHSALMVVALILAHVGRSQSKKAPNDRSRHTRAAVFFVLSLVAIAVAVPWAGRPLLRLS